MSAQDRFVDQADAYLDKHDVYGLFGSLMEQLAISQPSDPIPFLMSLLKQPPSKLRVILLGPPGFSAAPASKLESDFGVVRINFNDLGDAKALEASDEAAVALVVKRAKEADALKKGWVLENFPRNKHQAQLLTQAGLLVTHLIYLHTTAGQGNQNEQGKEAIEEFNRHAPHIADVFAATRTVVNADQANDEVWKAVKTALNTPAPSYAPRRPLRVALLGPKGAGKATQAAILASQLHVIPVSVASVLRDQLGNEYHNVKQGKQSAHPFAGKVAPFLTAGALIPDDTIIPLVIARLQQDDCRTHGWVLDGFPRTIKQAEALDKAGLKPSRVVIVSAPDQVVQERLSSFKGPLRAILNEYLAYAPDLATRYKGTSKTVDGTQERQGVTDEIRRFLLNSLASSS